MNGKRVSSLLVLILFAGSGAPRIALAAPPEWSLRDYVQTAWTHRDGVPLAPVSAITQTTDGYLWFLSQGTLVRFDGIRFVPVRAPCEPSAITSGVEGRLWLLCYEPTFQLFRRDATGLFTPVPLTGLPFRARPGLLHDSRGRLWVYSDLIARLEPDGRFRQFRGELFEPVRGAVEDSAGTIWLTTQKQVVRVRDDRLDYLPIEGVRAFIRDPSGGVFACGPSDRIRRLQVDSVTAVVRAPRDVIFAVGRQCGAVDAVGRLWIGTQQHGIAVVQSSRIETSLARNESGRSISSVFLDREGTTWVGSDAGLHRFRKPHVRLLSSAIAEIPAQPTSVFVDSRGAVWISGMSNFVRVNPDSGAHRVFRGWPARYAFGEDEAGRIWLGTAADIGYIEGDRFRPVRDRAGAPVPGVWAFSKDASGHLWAVAQGIGVYQVTPGPPRRVFDEPAAAQGLLVSSRHGVWVTLRDGGARQYTPGRAPVFHDSDQGGALGSALALVEDGDSIWLGDSSGLSRWRQHRWTRWTRAHGLPGAGKVLAIAPDRQGRLWLMTGGGLVVLSQADVAATPDGAPRSLRFAQIGALDRVLPHPGQPGTTPRVSMNRTGSLYFQTFDSIAIVDPATVTESSLRPTIVLESLAADNEPVTLAAPRRLTAPSRLQFEYTSLSLRSPENIRFRYRLDGYQDDWIDAGNERRVTYGTLRPGHYRFRVIGSGSEGVWNEEGAEFAFEVVPMFYNTWWFRGLGAAIIGATIAAMHRLRVRGLTHQMNLRFEERLAERSRIARELHDTLLQGTLAASLHVQLANEALTDGASSSAVEDALPPLQRAMQLLSQVADEGRATVTGLRSAPIARDLPDVLYRAARSQPNHGEVDFRVIVDGEIRSLKPHVAEEIGRIACEAITNAHQHAQARQIEAELVYTRAVFKCIVRDDGQGIDPRVLEVGREGHWGLTGMRERIEQAGGALHLRSSAAAGTEIQLSVAGPLAYNESAAPFSRWWRR